MEGPKTPGGDSTPESSNPSTKAAPEASTKAQATDPAPTEKPQAKKKNTTKIILIVGAALLLLCSICSVVLLVTGFGKDIYDSITGSEDEETEDDKENEEDKEEEEETEEDQEEDNDSSEPDEDEDQSNTFTGSEITGEYPDGWKIVEYTNGNGTDMLVAGPTYTGLTGIKVYAPGNKLVFEMKAVAGIGGTDACDKYYKFSDSSGTYYSDVVARSTAMGITPTVVDLTSSTYAEFTLFDRKTRRINKDLYYDIDSTTSAFDAACGIDYSFWSFSTLKFKADGTDSSAYTPEVKTSTTSSELTTLDVILDSLAAI